MPSSLAAHVEPGKQRHTHHRRPEGLGQFTLPQLGQEQHKGTGLTRDAFTFVSANVLDYRALEHERQLGTPGSVGKRHNARNRFILPENLEGGIHGAGGATLNAVYF